MTDDPKAEPLPFLKWAGGKRSVLRHLVPHFPAPPVGVYVEPFLGGGAVALHVLHALRPRRAVLADRNPQLIETYEVVRDAVEALIERLHGHAARHETSYYYDVRSEVPDEAVDRAARLIYLNKTCYNGLFRLNRKGGFNVPIGRQRNPRIVDPDGLRRVSEVLQSAELRVADFDEVLEVAGPAAFVYLDPPYDALSSTARFTAYDGHPFTADDQARLATRALALVDAGAHVVASNSDTPRMRALYADLEIHTAPVARRVNRDRSKRGHVAELVIVGRPGPT